MLITVIRRRDVFMLMTAIQRGISENVLSIVTK